MEKKQTAVEWLYFQFYNSKYFYKIIEDIENRGTIKRDKSILQIAKEMEKEQMQNLNSLKLN
jgi:hypothetical protein